MRRIGRRILIVCMVMVFTAAVFGCRAAEQTNQKNQEQSDENTTAYQAANLKVAALKGPTAIGMVKLMEDANEGKTANHYEFQIQATADVFTAALIKGEIQLAAMPCNAAATLYNKSEGKIKVIGINTLGVLYILDTGNSVQTVSDLKGKTIYLTGKGTTPEYTLRYLLKKAGINPDQDVKLEFKSEAAEVAAIMASEKEDTVAMLPQPYVTTVMNSNSKARIALDVTKEWEKLAGADSTVVTGVLAVNADYYQNNRAAVDKFMEEYQASVAYVNANVDAAAELVEQFDIFKAAVAKKAIPYCNITYVSGAQMKEKVENYLKVLYEENPNAVGGKMPDDAFYGM